MKSRYTTFDIRVSINELRTRLIGLRVVNVYDVDNKTYLIKLAKPDEKAVLLLESGIRIHSTEFEWPKNNMPSGFAMKMRKHLKSRRLEKIEQLGVDRIIDLQFGSNEAAYHIILELYDRGNIVLTDHEYLILNILRPRTDESQDVRFAVRETYPCAAAKQHQGALSEEWLAGILSAAKEGDNLKKILNPNLVYGPSVIDHCLLSVGLPINARVGKEFSVESDISRLCDALKLAEVIMFESSGTNKGYIIQQREKKPVISTDDATTELLTYSEFHPMLFKQHESQPFVECASFDKAVDEFFSKIESQKNDVKLLQQERSALKKLDRVKQDHVTRVEGLQHDQQIDVRKAQLIEINLALVDRAITVIRSALAHQIDWVEIQEMVNETAQQGDIVASSIKTLKLDTNHMTLLLKYQSDESDGSDDESLGDTSREKLKPMRVDIDLGLSAYSNARKYFDMKRHAATKELKTIGASAKALKSAERKTRQTLKDVRTFASINKARKTYWFEKFLWFISSENYLIIGGRDQQQNEIIVKRYLNPGDVYVHADLHGASSVVIKNSSRTEPIPPKTLNEAGTMALCNSAAWDAKVVTSSWWVYHDQVSKTAPSGEYLTTGSFMIRGKKNYLPPSYLIYGYGFLFKADETSVFRHKNERRIRTIEEDSELVSESVSEAQSDLNNDDLEEQKEEEEEEEEEEGTELQSNKSESSDSSSDNEEEGEGENPEEGGKRATDKQIHFTSFIPEEEEEAAAEDNNIPREATAVKEVAEFPDTNIQLQHVKGSQFTLRTDAHSQQEQKHENLVTENIPEDTTTGTEGGRGKVMRLSARQRRLMKKGKQCSGQNNEHETADDDPDVKSETISDIKLEPITQSSHDPASVKPELPIQLKRGQKSKLKKMRELYKDQDEEERKIKMDLLASARGPKEEKLKKGGKGGKMSKPSGPKQLSGGQTKDKFPVRLTAAELIVETPLMDSKLDKDENADPQVKAESKQAEDDEDDDNTHSLQVDDILDSLTGQPVIEDLLLFCLPVCAPYAALSNYKYKVKLVPGTTKRGKAAKLSVNMFISDKATTPREKDLFKSLKDTDLSRNMPGKVKVSHPNLHKVKHKS